MGAYMSAMQKLFSMLPTQALCMWLSGRVQIVVKHGVSRIGETQGPCPRLSPPSKVVPHVCIKATTDEHQNTVLAAYNGFDGESVKLARRHVLLVRVLP